MAGIDWRAWSAADRAAVAYLILKRNLASDRQALRELLLIADDITAVAALDREIMGQSAQIPTDR